MAKTNGFDTIQKKMKELGSFAEELDGKIAELSYNPHDPSSIENAIMQMNDAVDDKAKYYDGNDWVATVAEQLKDYARSKILELAAAARYAGKEE